MCRFAETKDSVSAWGCASIESLACRSKRLLRPIVGASEDVLSQRSGNPDTARENQALWWRGRCWGGRGGFVGLLVEANLFASPTLTTPHDVRFDLRHRIPSLMTAFGDSCCLQQSKIELQIAYELNLTFAFPNANSTSTLNSTQNLAVWYSVFA
jgi:hypothetical protein